MLAGLRFSHADGSRYGEPLSPKAADHAARAFQALTHMGFRAKETRQALDCIRNQGDSELTLAAASAALAHEAMQGGSIEPLRCLTHFG